MSWHDREELTTRQAADLLDEKDAEIASLREIIKSDNRYGNLMELELQAEKIKSLESRLEKVSLALGEMSEALVKSEGRLGRIHEMLTFQHPPRPIEQQLAVVESVIMQVIELAKPTAVEKHRRSARNASTR